MFMMMPDVYVTFAQLAMLVVFAARPAAAAARVVWSNATALGAVLVAQGGSLPRRVLQDAAVPMPSPCCAGTYEGSYGNFNTFNGDISEWDTSAVTTMFRMFKYNTAFNRDISAWDTSSVTNTEEMFMNAEVFNGDISAWDMSSVTNSRCMFYHYTRAFNADLSAWDFSSNTGMAEVFNRAHAFNGDLSGWSVSMVTTMVSMFYCAYSFNGDLSAWDISRVQSMSYMFSSSAMSTDLRTTAGGPWDVTGINTGNMYRNSCATSGHNAPARAGYPVCESTCAPFEVTPAGYTIANPSGTTISGLGARRCDARGYNPTVRCVGGSFHVSGCPVLAPFGWCDPASSFRAFRSGHTAGSDADIACPECPGDLDADFAITALDVMLLLSGFGLTDCTLILDYDGDCFIGTPDLLALLALFGNTC
jgi:surface protein